MIELQNENNSEQYSNDFKNALSSILSNWPIHVFLIFLAIRAVNRTNYSKLTKVKYYLAYSIFVLMLILCCVLCTPLMMLRAKNPSNMIITYPFACITSFLLGVDYELRGKEILAKDEAGVMVVNHQSSLDVLAHCKIMNVIKRCVIVSRKELLYFLPYSIFMTLAGSVFIDRKGGQTSNETLLNTCSVLSKHKSKLLIYPEGSRTLNAEKLKPFKKGGFRVAITAQIPVLPTVISPFYFIDAKKKHFTSGKVIIKALDPIPTEGLTMDNIDELIEKTWSLMSKEYENLKNEIAEFNS